MSFHISGQKLRNILFFGIAALSVIFASVPLHAYASSYTQHITIFDINVTKTWDADTNPEPVDVTMSYSTSFELENNSGTAAFPDSIQIYYGDDLCGTARKSGSGSDQTGRKQKYSVDLEIPFHFTSYDSATKSETIKLDYNNMEYSFDDIRLTADNHHYNRESGFFVDSFAIVDLDAIESSTFSESAESGREYDYSVSSSRSDNTVYEEDGDSQTTHTRAFTVTNSAIPAGKLELTAQKTLDNETPDQSFTFCLLDADGNILQTKQNDSDGRIQFDAMDYDSGDIGQEYTYQVKEQEGSDEGITYDSSVYTVKVSPRRDPDDSSVIDADPVITKDGEEVSAIVFNNVTESAGALELTAQKTVDNGTPDQSYTFCLLDADGNILQTKQNNSDGRIQFDAIDYDNGDIGQEYTYQVKEQEGSVEGITYDSSVYIVRVTPRRDPDDSSVIDADPVITKDGEEVSAIAFNNTTAANSSTTTAESSSTTTAAVSSTTADTGSITTTAADSSGTTVDESNSSTTVNADDSDTTTDESSSETAGESVDTGDHTEPVLWLFLFILAAAVLGIALKRRKHE